MGKHDPELRKQQLNDAENNSFFDALLRIMIIRVVVCFNFPSSVITPFFILNIIV